MKRIFLFIVACSLAMPSYMLHAQEAAASADAVLSVGTAPSVEAAPSVWLSWFKSLRRPTRQDVLQAQQFVKSQWRCMVYGQACTITERNTLRVLAAAVAAAVAAAMGLGYKRYQKKKRDEQQRLAEAAAAAEKQERAVRKGEAARPARNRKLAIHQIILDLKANEETTVPAQAVFKRVPAQAVFRRRPITVHEWGTPAGVAEAAIWMSDIDLLRRLIQEKAVNLKKHNVNLSSVLHHKYSASPRNSLDFMKVIVKAPGVDSEYLSQGFGRYNQTLLYEAVKEYPNPEFVELLLEAGIRPATAGIREEDALLNAVEAFVYARNRKEYEDVLRTIKLLVTHGSNPDAEARSYLHQGKTVRQIAKQALEIALEKGNHYPRSQDDVDKAMEEVEHELGRKKRQEARSFMFAHERTRKTITPDKSIGLGDLPPDIARVIGKMLIPPAPRGSSADEDAAASAVGTSD